MQNVRRNSTSRVATAQHSRLQIALVGTSWVQRRGGNNALYLVSEARENLIGAYAAIIWGVGRRITAAAPQGIARDHSREDMR